MKELRFIFALEVIFTLLIVSCNNGKKEAAVPAIEDNSISLTVFEKLIGTWKNEEGNNFERWTRNGNARYGVTSYSVRGSDTSWNEQADVYNENGKWVFENTVKGQNEEMAVKFIAYTINENRVQFSNPAHDFPTDLNYTLRDSVTINAFIIGPGRDGRRDTIFFIFRKMVSS